MGSGKTPHFLRVMSGGNRWMSPCVSMRRVSRHSGLAGTQGLPMVRKDITNMISEKQDEAESMAPYGPWEGNEWGIKVVVMPAGWPLPF